MKNLLKALILFIGFISLNSCGQFSETSSSVVNNISYFRDNHTGLCFASITNNVEGKVTVITCVPCDSLKNVKIN